MTENNQFHNISNTGINEPPGFLYVDHIAIAVCSGEMEQHVKMYKQIGFTELHREEIESADQVREVLLKIGDSPNLIQLLEPLSTDSPVQKQIDRNNGRGGLVHVGLRVKNAQAAFDFLKEKGFHIIDKAPRPGSRGTTVFFLHPKSHDETPFGVLYEIVEETNGS